jgi:hypothetical protein
MIGEGKCRNQGANSEAMQLETAVGRISRRRNAPMHPSRQRRNTPPIKSGAIAPYAFSSFAARGAKYDRMPSAPARLKAIRLSSTTLSPSSQPLAAAAISIAYSPDTW